MQKGKYKVATLKKISEKIFQGIGKNESNNSEFTLLKVKNILKYQRIDFNNIEFVNNPPKSKLLQKYDIISPFIGESIRLYKFSIFDKDTGNFFVDNNTGVIRLKKQIANSRFVASIFSSEIGQFQIDKNLGGGAVPYLGVKNAEAILIPLPPINIQKEIGREIEIMFEKIHNLEDSADKELEKNINLIDEWILNL